MKQLTEDFCASRGLMKYSDRLNDYLAGRPHSYMSDDKELMKVVCQFNNWCQDKPQASHPVGVVLGRARNVSPHSGRELYRVSFAETIYEEVHPVQMEIIHEV